MRQQAFLLSALSFCPLFNLQTCFQTPDVNCRNMSQINTHSKSPRSSFLEFGSTVLSLITESVGANAGEDCWCHTFAAIKTAATKWPVTLSVSHIVWNLQIIALNASASVSGLWAEPENHYCTFDISKKYIFFLYHFVRQVLPHFLFQYCDLHTERLLVHYSHSQMHLCIMRAVWALLHVRMKHLLLLTVCGPPADTFLVSASHSQRRQKHSSTLCDEAKWTVTRTKQRGNST